jgi:hypothetical protein
MTGHTSPSRWMTLGFFAAALFNIVGMLVHTAGFTSYPAAALIPSLFGPDGCLLIVVWGMAYGAVARRWDQVPALCGVFAAEKLFYTFSWVRFWQSTSVDEVFRDHADAAPLLLAYGVGDGLFGLMFAVAAVIGLRRE